MFIQYAYALLTMLPCPVWFWYRWASAAFLMAVFCWSVYNGATFYIDVFGNRFQKELEAMRREVAKMGLSPELHGDAGGGGKNGKEGREGGKTDEEKQRMVNVGESANSVGVPVDKIPLLSPGTAKGVSSARDAESGVAKERKGGNS